MSEPILKVDQLTTTFRVARPGLFGGSQPLHAISDVSFQVNAGETLGIVGESGCGKSTLGRSILRLIEPNSGRIQWQDNDLIQYSAEQMRQARRDMQIIFQDPVASLDPRMTVGQIIAEPLDVFEKSLSRTQRETRVLEIMAAVGLTPEMINRYPHEFSGGQAQRIGIARAVITHPKMIICDEPVSALDVSVQAQIINLLRELREKFQLTLLFISHDLSVVRLTSDRILVLYLGRVVESGPTHEIFSNPQHPYTQALLSAAPIPDPAIRRKRIPLTGDPPSPLNLPSGCSFHTRCPKAQSHCRNTRPELRNVRGETLVACDLV